MREEFSAKEIFMEIACVFFASVIAMSLAGYFLNVQENKEVSLFVKNGLSYSAIFQLVCFSVCATLIRILCISNLLFKKLSYIKRILIFIIIIWLMTNILSVLFHWFLTNTIFGWLLFNLSFLISFAVCAVISGFLFYSREKKYAKLLDNYKNNKKE